MSRSRAKKAMHDATEEPPIYKIAVIGDGGVGKTAITLQYITHEFLGEYDPTIEDEYRKTAVIDGEEVIVNVLDTTGEERWGGMVYPYAREFNAYVVVHDICSQKSPEHSEQFLMGVLRERDEHNTESVTPVVVFVGNKTDREAAREVSFDEGKALADKYNAPYVEISAKNYEETEAVFDLTVKKMREELPQDKPKPQPAPCSVM